MNRITVWLFLFALAIGVALSGPAKADDKKAEDGFVALFNGKDFADWKIVGEKDSEKAWVIHKNAIVKRKFQSMLASPGKPTSCLLTAKSYKNYVLRFDWQFEGGEAKKLKDDTDYEGDSGCLVHIQPPYKVWPKAVEVAGKPKELGKLLPLGGKLVGDLQYDQAAKNKALKKDIGEWNTTEITCGADGSIKVALNGVVISSGKTDLTEGAIGFKTDGPKIWYANIELKQLK